MELINSHSSLERSKVLSFASALTAHVRIEFLACVHPLGLRSVLTRRHVTATCHKCRCNTLRRQTTPCARSGDKLLQQLMAHFVAVTSRRKSNQFEFVQLVAATNFVAATKIFTKILQYIRSDLSQRRVAAT